MVAGHIPLMDVMTTFSGCVVRLARLLGEVALELPRSRDRLPGEGVPIPGTASAFI